MPATPDSCDDAHLVRRNVSTDDDTMTGTATRSASTFAALLGVLMHAVMLLSTGLAAGAASAAQDDRGGPSVFWSLCINGQFVTKAEADTGDGGGPADPAQGVPACPLCTPTSGVALIPPELPSVRPSELRIGDISRIASAGPHARTTIATPPARAPPHSS